MEESSPADNDSERPLKKARLDKTELTSASIPVVPLPAELVSVDFSQRISWDKYHPYSDIPLPYTPLGTAPAFVASSPALCHHVHALSGRARACTVHLQPQPGQLRSRPLPTPMFMPVGTKGCLKGLAVQELVTDPALSCPIILGNTYHLAIQPGTELVDEMGGLHAFQGLPETLNGVLHEPDPNTITTTTSAQPYNLLTDSGGFQMVSLVKLSKITEEGVSFQNPFQKHTNADDVSSMLLLRPEDSIRHQNNIGANIIMALDDVVSSVMEDEARFVTATHRTLRWYDRCVAAHAKADTQNLFPIVQGGLDIALGGKREQCLAGFRHRAVTQGYCIPGYAIGGLAGGESKDDFWRVVDQCCRALPDDKPRYLMGVGYPLDLVVCTALGCDLYDCVYPTRTARFGVALVPGRHPGTLRLKAHECASDTGPIQDGCGCQACREGISRARLHLLLKTNNPLAAELVTQHNIAYMMTLVRDMRNSILRHEFAAFATNFVQQQFPGERQGGDECPAWVKNALEAAGVGLLK